MKSTTDRSIFATREDIKKNLRSKTVRGAYSRVIGNGTAAALIIGSTIVLARILTPEEFGLFTMVLAFTELARYIGDLGLGTSTIQREEINHEEVSTLFWINVGFGAVLMLVVAAISPLVSWFYGDRRLLSICKALSATFLLTALSVQHRALLERQMQFGRLTIVHVLSTLIGICVAIIMATRGFGVWALVWRELITAATYCVGVWLLCRWMPGAIKLSAGVRSSIRFGAHLSSFSIIRFFTNNLDRVLIGRFYGATSVGLYGKAMQLAMLPVEHVRMTIMGVALSPLSALHNDPERYRRFYTRLLSILAFVYMPILVFVGAHPEGVILLLLGEQWVSAAPMLRIFAAVGFVAPILSACQLMMVSFGKSRSYSIYGIIDGVCVTISFVVGIWWGAIGVAYAYAIGRYLTTIPLLMYCVKGTPITMRQIFSAINIPVISSVSAGIMLVVLNPVILKTNVYLNVVISMVFVAMLYMGIWLIIPRGRQQLREFKSYSGELFRRS